MNKIIGIISYLPLDEKVRNNRIILLKNLLNKCNLLFPNIPIYIIAQNWRNFTLDNYKNIWVTEFDKPLGIVEARKTLRRVFLDYSTADYLIMLDDDCELKGNSGEIYLKQIDENPDCFIEFNNTLLKLFAISRKLLQEVNFDDVKPELEEGFEDRVFVNKLRILYPNKRRIFRNTGIIEHSISTKDINSTWYNGQNLKKMLKETEEIIKNISKNS